jgi:CshA-type fibril repeat protein
LVNPATTLCGISVNIPNEGTWTIDQTTGVVTFAASHSVTSGQKTSVVYRITDIVGQTTTSTLTPVVPPAPDVKNDTSTDAYDTNQVIDILDNDDPGHVSAPLVASTVRLCGLDDPATSGTNEAETAPNCTKSSVAVPGEGTYTVNADGIVTFDPVSTLTTTVATPPRYQVADTLGQVVNATITPTVAAPPPPIASPGTVSLIAGGTETFSSIFGTSGLARKDTGGPDLTTSSVCIIAPSTTTCDPDNIVAISGQGTFTLDPATGIVTYEADPTATDGVKTAVTYKIVDALNVAATSTLTPTIYPKPTALPDYSMGVMEATQTLSPFGNDSPGAAANPLEKSSIKLCGVGETAPACTKTSVTVTGQGTYTVQSNGTVTDRKSVV